MKDVYTFLALCHKTWPTPQGVRHNITLADDGRICISIQRDDFWHNFCIFEDALCEPVELVSRIKGAIDSFAAVNA